MRALLQEVASTSRNPLDLIEEMVGSRDWPFERLNNDEMVAEMPGRWCDYRLFFGWATDTGALHFTSTFDAKVPTGRRGATHELLAQVNERLWAGHFEICPQERTPLFRHTLLLRGSRGVSVEQVEDLLDLGGSECERFYPAFQFVAWGGKSAQEALDCALLETVGEA